jgi:hypothetical protein
MAKLIVAFCNFADAPKYTECCITMLHGQFSSPATVKIMLNLPVLKEIIFQIICNISQVTYKFCIKQENFRLLTAFFRRIIW